MTGLAQGAILVLTMHIGHQFASLVGYRLGMRTTAR